MQEDFVESWWRVQEVMNLDPSKRESGRLNFIKIKPTVCFFFFFLSIMIRKFWVQLLGNPTQSLLSEILSSSLDNFFQESEKYRWSGLGKGAGQMTFWSLSSTFLFYEPKNRIGQPWKVSVPLNFFFIVVFNERDKTSSQHSVCLFGICVLGQLTQP